MKLFIAEKPSLAQAIAAGIGVGKKSDGYISLNGGEEIVTWCYGHILEQLSPNEYAEKYRAWRMEDLPIIPSEWKLKVKPDAAKQFKIVCELIGKATTIINADDPDREGQLLVDEVLDYVGNKKPVQRILLNALDEKSVRQALKDLRDNDEFQGMKNAALGRSRVDWLIGMNLSRAYTIRARQVGYEGVSVGRVMTPTMALVVRRENEIAKFKPVTHYAVKAIFANNFGEILATWQMTDNVASLDSEGRLLDKKVAENFLARLNALVGRQGKIIRVEEKNKTENQRLPYSLSTLQIEAGKRYGYSPQTVLDTMQTLYEKKLTTYPRSDCEYLPENQFSDSKKILGHLKDLPDFSELVRNADTSIHSKAWNDKKISAHHAIIPTRIKADFEKLNSVEQNLYVMVSQAYLAQFYLVHEYKATTVIISFADEKFVGKGKLVTKLGWKTIYKNVAKSESEEAESILPPVKESELVKYISGNIAEKTTKPPTRFTPSTLLQAMKEIYKYVKDAALKAELKECSGIGTEATRAGIIEKLQDNGFLELTGKFFAPTEKARMAVKILPEEMIARAFEVYLKEKLRARGIQNDYLVNYRSDESWAKASESGFKMDNTYPYPTATEVEDIKAAFDFLFDSIRFKSHDENYELYSASTADIRECMKNSRLLFDRELTFEQTALQKMSDDVFGIDVKYFEGAPELHGRFDDDRDIVYLNGKSETSLDWAFWHEAFHVMKKHEPELYEDILAHVERHEIFTSHQIENYRKAVKQPKMSKTKAMEEMLADAFADMKTSRRVIEEISKENRSLADKLAVFTQKLLDGVKKFFTAKEVHEKYPSVTLTSKQFKDFFTRIDENICSMQDGKNKAAANSTGYKILQAVHIPHSPYKYTPKSQKDFDTAAAKKLAEKYSADSIQQVIQDLSPSGHENKNYGKEIMQEVKAYGR